VVVVWSSLVESGRCLVESGRCLEDSDRYLVESVRVWSWSGPVWSCLVVSSVLLCVTAARCTYGMFAKIVIRLFWKKTKSICSRLFNFFVFTVCVRSAFVIVVKHLLEGGRSLQAKLNNRIDVYYSLYCKYISTDRTFEMVLFK